MLTRNQAIRAEMTALQKSEQVPNARSTQSFNFEKGLAPVLEYFTGPTSTRIEVIERWGMNVKLQMSRAGLERGLECVSVHTSIEAMPEAKHCTRPIRVAQINFEQSKPGTCRATLLYLTPKWPHIGDLTPEERVELRGAWNYAVSEGHAVVDELWRKAVLWAEERPPVDLALAVTFIQNNILALKQNYHDFSPSKGGEILNALPTAYKHWLEDGGRWGPGIVGKEVATNAATVGRYLKAFRSVGLRDWAGVLL